MVEGYLTTKQVAEKLGVSEGRVRQLVSEGRLPSVKVGHTNLVRESDIELVKVRKRTGRPPKVKENE
jgi:excisionase family DNA binding protein